jgi:hypothetical protein
MERKHEINRTWEFQKMECPYLQGVSSSDMIAPSAFYAAKCSLNALEKNPRRSLCLGRWCKAHMLV